MTVSKETMQKFHAQRLELVLLGAALVKGDHRASIVEFNRSRPIKDSERTVPQELIEAIGLKDLSTAVSLFKQWGVEIDKESPDILASLMKDLDRRDAINYIADKCNQLSATIRLDDAGTDEEIGKLMSEVEDFRKRRK